MEAGAAPETTATETQPAATATAQPTIVVNIPPLPTAPAPAADPVKPKWERMLGYAMGGALGVIGVFYLVPILVTRGERSETFIQTEFLTNMKAATAADVKNAESSEELAKAVNELRMETRLQTESFKLLAQDLRAIYTQQPRAAVQENPANANATQ